MILASERRVGDQSHDLADVWHCHDYTFYLINIKTGEVRCHQLLLHSYNFSTGRYYGALSV